MTKKSLQQLREARQAGKPAARPERAMTICLAPDKVAEMQALSFELDELPKPSASRRIGVGEHPRASKIRTRMAELLEEMADYDGELRVRAIDDGEWRRWANEHPARPAPQAETEETPGTEGEPGWLRDLQVARGYCNADDLIDDLGKYAWTWNGEELAEGDWDTVLRPDISGADLKEIARAVMGMHESRLDFTQWRSRLSAALTRSDDSEQPETSESAPDASTDGSPAPSNAATTKTAPRSRSTKPGK